MKTDQDSVAQSQNQNIRLWRLMDHTRFMISRLREKEFDQFGLTPEQAHILDILLHRKGVSTINEIVEITQRKHHSISTQIDRMSKQGLVNRKRKSEDLREYEVSITRRGQILLGQVTRESINQSFNCLSSDEKANLDNYLTRLLRQVYKLHGKELKTTLPKD